MATEPQAARAARDQDALPTASAGRVTPRHERGGAAPGPAPSPTATGAAPATGAASAPAGDAATGLAALLGGTTPSAPVPALVPVLSSEATLNAEQESIRVSRNTVRGLLATASPMLKILHEGAPKMKAALAALIVEQPAAAVRLLGELAKTIDISVKASERLIQAQRVLDGTPNQTVRVEHATAPPPRLSDEQLEAEIRRVRDTVDRLTRDDEAIDVEPANVQQQQGGAS